MEATQLMNESIIKGIEEIKLENEEEKVKEINQIKENKIKENQIKENQIKYNKEKEIKEINKNKKTDKTDKTDKKHSQRYHSRF